MVLYVDVGNTHTVFAIKMDGEFVKWRLTTGRFETEDEVFSNLKTLLDVSGIDHGYIDEVVVASVVPSLDHVFEKMARKYFRTDVLWVVADGRCGVRWPVDNPKEIGADRVANVIGAVHLYFKDSIVLDFGTAITIDVVSDGEFLGGSISPGIMTMLYSLFSGTAKLPLVDLKLPKTSIGRNTEDNIRIGILKWTAHAMNGLVEDVKRELGKDMKIIVTGGQSKLVLDLLKYDIFDSDLTIKGMEIFRRLHSG